jgi:hypothetical protein
LPQVLTKAPLAMRAEAIVTVKIVADEPIHAPPEAFPHPGLHDLLPGGIPQAGPVLRHPADGVGAVRDGRSVGAAFQEFQGIRHGFWAQPLFVPEIAIEFKEAARTVRTIGIADEEFHIEMTHHFGPALMDLAIEILEPVAQLSQAAHGEVRRIAAVLGSMSQTPEMRAIEADLCNLGLRVLDKF